MPDKIHTTGAELAALTPEIWSQRFYPTLLEQFPFNDVVARDYEGEIQALGDTVNITTFPQFGEAQEINEDERVDADAVTAQNIPLIINKQVAKDFILSKRSLRQSIDSENQLRDLALHSLMKKMQSVIIADIVPSASAPDHQIAYDSGTTLTLADILEAKTLLDDSDVEEEGRCMINGPQQHNDLFNITGFVSRDFIPSGSPLTSGDIATPVLGFTPKKTSLVVDTTYLFHPIFMQVAVQQVPDTEVFNLGVDGKRGRRVNMDVLFGVKQASDLRVVTIS